MEDLKRNEDRILIRDARPDDAPFLAKCIMAGMPHLIRLYESIGFVPADRRHAFGVDFQKMVIPL